MCGSDIFNMTRLEVCGELTENHYWNHLPGGIRGDVEDAVKRDKYDKIRTGSKMKRTRWFHHRWDAYDHHNPDTD